MAEVQGTSRTFGKLHRVGTKFVPEHMGKDLRRFTPNRSLRLPLRRDRDSGQCREENIFMVYLHNYKLMLETMQGWVHV